MKRQLLPFAVASSALLGGIFYSSLLGDTIRYADEAMYISLAKNLITAGAYSLDGSTATATRPPGYPLFLCLAFMTGGGLIFGRIVQFACYALSMILLFYILRAWGHQTAGIIAVILVLGYPVLFYTAGTFYPQTLTSFLLLIAVYYLIRPQPRLSDYFAGALVLGMLFLTTPPFLALLPLFLLSRWYVRARTTPAAAAVFLVLSVAPTLLWTTRNAIVFKRFVFVSANSGLVLLLGNSEHAEANIGPRTDISRYAETARREGMDEVARDVYYKHSALEWMLSNKLTAIQLYGRKFLTHFHYRNELASEAEMRPWRDAVMFGTYYPILCLAALAVFLGGRLRERPFELFGVLSYLMVGAAYAIFFTRIRYRLPVDWLAIGMAAISVAHLGKRVLKGSISEGSVQG
jgi:4-amino-4-deoxy-L-arabinose transferase-like glycosyltransferase